MEQSGKIKVTGKIRLEHSNGTIWESNNFVVNLGVHTAGEILGGNTTGSIFRVAIGDGGVSGGSRVLPDDSWYLKTGLVSPAYSDDIMTRTVTHDGQTTSLYFEHVFTSGDHVTAMTHASEMCLIVGYGTTGIIQSPVPAVYMPTNPPIEDNHIFAYRTFEELPLATGGIDSITMHWTILLENG